jgi:hypothetical protein
MWISKAMQARFDAADQRCVELQVRLGHNIGASDKLAAENVRLRSDLDWFKHRLNQVERERGQLIQSAIGVKIAVPEFVPTFDPSEALNPGGNPFEEMAGSGVDVDPKEDYSMMPGFRGQK